MRVLMNVSAEVTHQRIHSTTCVYTGAINNYPPPPRREQDDNALSSTRPTAAALGSSWPRTDERNCPVPSTAI
jgi:hypothetical protein